MISPFFFILVSAGDCRLIRLRGGRSSADSARGTRPSGLPSIACGRDEGRICPFICAASASLSACEYNNIVLFLFSIYCVIRRCGHNWKFFTGCKNRKSLFFVDGMQTVRPLIRTARMFFPKSFYTQMSAKPVYSLPLFITPFV